MCRGRDRSQVNKKKTHTHTCHKIDENELISFFNRFLMATSTYMFWFLMLSSELCQKLHNIMRTEQKQPKQRALS